MRERELPNFKNNRVMTDIVSAMRRKESTMTNREFYTAIANLTEIPAELVEFANESLVKMDARNEKAKTRPRKENAEVAGRKAAVAEFIATNEGEFTADEIAETLGMTSAQVSSALRMHVAAGAVTKGNRKIDSKHTKVVYKIGA